MHAYFHHILFTPSQVTFTTQNEYQQVTTMSGFSNFWVGVNVTAGMATWAAGPEGALLPTLTAESNQLIASRGLWNPLNDVHVQKDNCVVIDAGTWSSASCSNLLFQFIIEYERCKVYVLFVMITHEE